MVADWRANARSVLDELQAKVTARDLPGLRRFFEEPAVLIGTAGDGRTPEAREAYLEAVVAQRAAVLWEWRETLLFYEATDAFGFAAFGDVVLTDVGQAIRAPIRATFFAVRTDRGWRLREFHGSIAQAPT